MQTKNIIKISISGFLFFATFFLSFDVSKVQSLRLQNPDREQICFFIYFCLFALNFHFKHFWPLILYKQCIYLSLFMHLMHFYLLQRLLFLLFFDFNFFLFVNFFYSFVRKIQIFHYALNKFAIIYKFWILPLYIIKTFTNFYNQNH